MLLLLCLLDVGQTGLLLQAPFLLRRRLVGGPVRRGLLTPALARLALARALAIVLLGALDHVHDGALASGCCGVGRLVAQPALFGDHRLAR
eukprot:8873931-Pyramimonas_sp.AAC.1